MLCARLLDQEDAFAVGEVGFLAQALVQATLPHSDPKQNEFVRRNGDFTLSILAPKDVALPYGRYPRLVLASLTTEAVRRKSPDIEFDRYFSQFLVSLSGSGSVPASCARGLRGRRGSASPQRVLPSYGRLLRNRGHGISHAGPRAAA